MHIVSGGINLLPKYHDLEAAEYLVCGAKSVRPSTAGATTRDDRDHKSPAKVQFSCDDFDAGPDSESPRLPSRPERWRSTGQ